MKILVGISGGVDSAYAAKKLLLSGAQVEGAVLKMHEYTEIDDARKVCESLGIDLHIIDCTKSFDETVKRNFAEEYAGGRTPNPCIICNEKVKFKYLYEYAMENDFDAIATGHYAKVVKTCREGLVRYTLSGAKDLRKDQTYMLYRLPQQILEKLLLPLGEETKEDIRKNAFDLGIFSAEKQDSQEICFLPMGEHADFVESVMGECPEGDFISEDGEVLGKHKGIVRYTIGQRKGLGISLGSRAFVTDIDPIKNTVTLSTDMGGCLTVELYGMVYSGMIPPTEDITVHLSAKLRYSTAAVATEVTLRPDGTAVLRFEVPQKAAPGQSAVLYDGDRVMCGGFIASKRR